MQVELWIFPLDQDCQSGLTQHGVTEGDRWKRQMIFGGSTSCDALLIGSRFDNKQQQERKMKIKVTLISSHQFHESAHCKIWPKQIGQTHKTQLMLPKPFCGPHVLPDSWAVSRKQEWWIAALAASSSSNTFENSRRGRNTHGNGQFLSNWFLLESSIRSTLKTSSDTTMSTSTFDQKQLYIHYKVISSMSPCMRRRSSYMRGLERTSSRTRSTFESMPRRFRSRLGADMQKTRARRQLVHKLASEHILFRSTIELWVIILVFRSL